MFKIYTEAGGKNTYEAESDVYSALTQNSDASKTITKFYGSFSFENTEKRVIILEYAPGGSLLDFLKDTPPPIYPADLKLLWKRLTELLEGLYILHHIQLSDREGNSSPFFAG